MVIQTEQRHAMQAGQFRIVWKLQPRRLRNRNRPLVLTLFDKFDDLFDPGNGRLCRGCWHHETLTERGRLVTSNGCR